MPILSVLIGDSFLGVYKCQNASNRTYTLCKYVKYMYTFISEMTLKN